MKNDVIRINKGVMKFFTLVIEINTKNDGITVLIM